MNSAFYGDIGQTIPIPGITQPLPFVYTQIDSFPQQTITMDVLSSDNVKVDLGNASFAMIELQVL
ncbi:MAG: hypothetical protein C7B45_13080 [Sulfobacillus acidophilus]|uniref:Uncharacterized protein n=1 Tax=Sulfobacillus acidophilus TaxID=53633 RepID=A0A2T2WF68_9FIRM|nr:MAG: hypothetical protein C7B45_13080 [Sulfobacillus acidophilus]